MGAITAKATLKRAWKEALAEVRIDTPVRFMTAVVSPFISAGLVWWATGNAPLAGGVGVAVLFAILLAVFTTKLFTVPLEMAKEAYRERAELSDRVTTLEATIAKLKEPPPKPARDPNGVYQLEALVGHGHNVRRMIGDGLVVIGELSCTGEFNQSQDFEYQDLALRLDSFDYEASVGGLAANPRKAFFNARCVIVRRL